MNTNDPLIPASTILPCWTGRYITSFVRKVEAGLQAERQRLQGKPYIVFVWRHVFVYDGLTEYVDALESFLTADQALAFAYLNAKEAKESALATQTYGNYKWKQGNGGNGWGYFEKHEQPKIDVIGRERFYMENGSGYDFFYTEYLALHVQAPEILGNELFSYLGNEYEIMRYLSEVG